MGIDKNGRFVIKFTEDELSIMESLLEEAIIARKFYYEMKTGRWLKVFNGDYPTADISEHEISHGLGLIKQAQKVRKRIIRLFKSGYQNK